MKAKTTIQLLLTGGLLAGTASARAQNGNLWYDRPAQTWTEALPLGNGRLGAMVYGNPVTEQIQLNEETIWAGSPNNNANPDGLEYIPKVRELVFRGDYLEAQTLATQKVMAQTNSGMPYQPFGDLRIAFPSAHARYGDYRRELSLDSARAVVTYNVDGVGYRRETIASFSGQVVTVRLTADRPGMITCSALLTSPHQDATVETRGDTVALSGVTATHERQSGKLRFQGRLSVRTSGGRTTCKDGAIAIEQANEAVFYVSIATAFNTYNDISGDPAARARGYLEKAMAGDYRELKARHTALFKACMDRVALQLGEDNYAHLPTDIRVRDFHLTHDAHLVATYFHFGRYLLICSSQPGGQPANLQGIWNDKMLPPWDSKYTCNINAEMNYWPAEPANLSELHEPLLRLAAEVSRTGRETAEVMYGAGGWVLHHNTDLWRITGPVDRAPSGMWPTGGAWLCRHLWEHYLYTADRDFLRSIYPILKEAARFFDEIMVYEPSHRWLVVCPSLSPENPHAGSQGKATTAAGCTMDNQLIFDLWNTVITAARLLDVDAQLAGRLEQRLAEMPPMQIGRWGQLQEWLSDWDDPDDKHRHVSHLYGLFPGNQISPYRTPELFDAARTSLIARGDPSTGWSMGWKVCLWARLLDGDHAYKLITDQLTLVRNEKKGGTYPNLFDAHPPFQIDGNFGCTAGIIEMLMQSHDAFVYILPALPALWPTGEVKGIVARGGFEIDLRWKAGNVETITIRSRNGGNCRLRTRTPIAGAGLKKAGGENPNPIYTLPETPAPLIHTTGARPKAARQTKTYLYDLPTEAGKSYVLTSTHPKR
ncbi:MAG: glycoside hydrolase family 95 protein [Mediterranea sp.]|jgi:alpha-L-fucosidase 2|nr:glycoside hydrolase family 95 protein [Mediterranea sp.]